MLSKWSKNIERFLLKGTAGIRKGIDYIDIAIRWAF